jgi:hypothetical protein
MVLNTYMMLESRKVHVDHGCAYMYVLLHVVAVHRVRAAALEVFCSLLRPITARHKRRRNGIAPETHESTFLKNYCRIVNNAMISRFWGVLIEV